jgi:hypothetical protein
MKNILLILQRPIIEVINLTVFLYNRCKVKLTLHNLSQELQNLFKLLNIRKGFQEISIYSIQTAFFTEIFLMNKVAKQFRKQKNLRRHQFGVEHKKVLLL